MEKNHRIKKRMANLKPFKKGQSGNPKGRPKKLPELKTILDDVFGSTDETGTNSRMKKIFVAMANKAQRGNVQAAKLILDLYEYVQPKLSRASIDFDFENLSNHDLARMLAIARARRPKVGVDLEEELGEYELKEETYE